MPSRLPASPNLSQLKRQARELHKAHQEGDVTVCGRIQKAHPRFSQVSDVLGQPFSLRDAQLVIAREYAFVSWSKLKEYVESLAGREPGQLDTMATLRQLFKERFEISKEQVHAILEPYDLGRVKAMESLESNLMNTVFDLSLEKGPNFILKVQHRPTPGWSLETEYEVIELLRQKTDLPVSEFCSLDVSERVIPHPYLLSSKLPGANGKTFFEAADVADQMALCERLGEITGMIHGVGAAKGLGHGLSFLAQWRRVVVNALRGDAALQDEIEAFAPDFSRSLTGLSIWCRCLWPTKTGFFCGMKEHSGRWRSPTRGVRSR